MMLGLPGTTVKFAYKTIIFTCPYKLITVLSHFNINNKLTILAQNFDGWLDQLPIFNECLTSTYI